jgi:hypothetical protein
MKRVLLLMMVTVISMVSFGQLIADGVYTIENGWHTGRYLSTFGTQSAGAKVYLSTTPDQKWQIKHIGANVYKISLLNTSLLLDVTDAIQANDAKIQVWSANNNAAQTWMAVAAGDGSFYFKSFGGNGRNLDAAPYSNAAQIITWDANGGTNQRWKLKAVPAANGVATFYSNCNYGGNAVNLPAGNYTLAQLQYYGISNDDIDALRVAGGYTVTLFADDNFSGDRRSFTADFACLIDAARFENRTTSLKIEATSTLPATAAIFYPNCNFGGYPVSLPVGTYTLAQLKRVGINNDDIDALRVPKGYRVVLFADDNGGGDRRVIPFDYSCLYNANHFDNKTTSLKIETYNPAYNAATVYGDCNYGGYAISLPEGAFNRDDLIVWGVPENTISSVKVKAGYWVQLLDQPYFANSAYIKFDFNSPCLADPSAGFNDVTSSLVISWMGDNLLRGGAAQATPHMEKGGFETAGTSKTVISPNPASTSATIIYNAEAASAATLEIAGAAGNILEKRNQGVVKGLNRLTVDVSKLANGTYFVIISNNGKKETIRLVVQH